MISENKGQQQQNKLRQRRNVVSLNFLSVEDDKLKENMSNLHFNKNTMLRKHYFASLDLFCEGQITIQQYMERINFPQHYIEEQQFEQFQQGTDVFKLIKSHQKSQPSNQEKKKFAQVFKINHQTSSKKNRTSINKQDYSEVDNSKFKNSENKPNKIKYVPRDNQQYFMELFQSRKRDQIPKILRQIYNIKSPNSKLNNVPCKYKEQLEKISQQAIMQRTQTSKSLGKQTSFISVQNNSKIFAKKIQISNNLPCYLSQQKTLSTCVSTKDIIESPSYKSLHHPKFLNQFSKFQTNCSFEKDFQDKKEIWDFMKNKIQKINNENQIQLQDYLKNKKNSFQKIQSSPFLEQFENELLLVEQQLSPKISTQKNIFSQHHQLKNIKINTKQIFNTTASMTDQFNQIKSRKNSGPYVESPIKQQNFHIKYRSVVDKYLK